MRKLIEFKGLKYPFYRPKLLKYIQSFFQSPLHNLEAENFGGVNHEASFLLLLIVGHCWISSLEFGYWSLLDIVGYQILDIGHCWSH